MTAYEIISLNLSILTLLCAFGSLIVAFLSFDKTNKKGKRRKRKK